MRTIRTHSTNNELVDVRREHIVRHAIDLFTKQGYGRTSVREIARACGMNIGTLYYYIGTKSDMVLLAFDYCAAPWRHWIERLANHTSSNSATETLKQTIRFLHQWVDKTDDFILFSYQAARHLEPEVWQKQFELDELIRDNIERVLISGCETGEFQIEDTRLVAHDILVDAEMWAVRRWFLREHYTLEEYIAKRTELVLRAIFMDKGRTSGVRSKETAESKQK